MANPASTDRTYQHPTLGPRVIDLTETIRMLRKVTDAYSEVIEQLYEYDGEHPYLWATCSEHGTECGQRDLPRFFLTACMTACDVQDAQTLLEAWDYTDG